MRTALPMTFARYFFCSPLERCCARFVPHLALGFGMLLSLCTGAAAGTNEGTEQESSEPASRTCSGPAPSSFRTLRGSLCVFGRTSPISIPIATPSCRRPSHGSNQRRTHPQGRSSKGRIEKARTRHGISVSRYPACTSFRQDSARRIHRAPGGQLALAALREPLTERPSIRTHLLIRISSFEGQFTGAPLEWARILSSWIRPSRRPACCTNQ